MREHPGNWPKNWGELSNINLSAPSQCADFHWPEQLDEFRRRVLIDFSLTRTQVANMTEAQFSAVLPIGPHFELEDHWIHAFLSVARQGEEMKGEGLGVNPERKGSGCHRHQRAHSTFLDILPAILCFMPRHRDSEFRRTSVRTLF
jgi:hypothetical protein